MTPYLYYFSNIFQAIKHMLILCSKNQPVYGYKCYVYKRKCCYLLLHVFDSILFFSLFQSAEKFFKEYRHEAFTLVDKMNFVNFWLLLIVLSDICIIAGSSIKIALDWMVREYFHIMECTKKNDVTFCVYVTFQVKTSTLKKSL